MASSSSSNYSSSPCAACKFLRRKCLPGCIFAPYFPPEEPQKFSNVHKIFGASNVSKLLNEIHPHQREDAVNSLAYEAEARMKDPVYGCVGAISVLQRQVVRLQKELDATNADLMRFTGGGGSGVGGGGGEMHTAMPVYPASTGMASQTGQRAVQYGRRMGHGQGHGGGSFDHNSGFHLPYNSTWSHNPSGDSPEGGDGGM